MRTLEITDEQAVLIVDHDGNVSFLPAKGEEAQVTNAGKMPVSKLNIVFLPDHLE